MPLPKLSSDLKYVIVGILTSITSIVLLGLFVEVVGLYAVTANILQWIITTYMNFLLLCIWVYYANPLSIRLVLSNFAARGGTFISVQSTFICMTLLSVQYYTAYIISAFGGFIVNYLLARNVVFKQQRKEMM